MHAVYIYEINPFSFFKNAFLFKKNCRKFVKECKHMDIAFMRYGFPAETLMQNERKMEKYIEFLKEEGVSHILLSDELMLKEEIFRKFSEHFILILGTNVINYKLFDILRKCAHSKEMELAKSTLVLETDDPSRAEEIILRLYKHVKKIRIQTEQRKAFNSLVEYFMYEYGIYIETEAKITNENEICVMLDEKNEKQADIYVSTNSFKHTKVYFKTKNISDNYFEKKHQAIIEFLIFNKYAGIKEAAIDAFFKDYQVRIIKFENNN